MLALGKLGMGFGDERECNFTKEEQVTMMTLWCIFRSPMMIGTELTKMDDWTKSLLTNAQVLRLLKHSKGARQMERDESHVIWCAMDAEENAGYLAAFNLEDGESGVSIPWSRVEDYGIRGRKGRELWSGEEVDLSGKNTISVPRHGAKLIKIWI